MLGARASASRAGRLTDVAAQVLFEEGRTMTTIATSTYVKKGEGQALWVLGSLFDIKAGAHETGGSLAVVEMTFAPGKPGAPPHRHHCGEAAYVLEGTIRYHIEDQVVDATPGDFLFFPEGTLEWMENPTAQPARALVIYDRPGIVDFFNEVGEAATSRTLPPPSEKEPDLASVAAIAGRHGLDIVLPSSR
jgi:quercetin dioxygenase-like cupin family protein